MELKLRYNKVMKFEEQIMQCEFEKAERMLKRTDKLVKKYKKKTYLEEKDG